MTAAPPATCRFLEQGSTLGKPILVPHQLQDELQKVCEECNNASLKTSDFGCLVQSIQEVKYTSMQNDSCIYPAPSLRRTSSADAQCLALILIQSTVACACFAGAGCRRWWLRRASPCPYAWVWATGITSGCTLRT